jgi:hypothetical protein
MFKEAAVLRFAADGRHGDNPALVLFGKRGAGGKSFVIWQRLAAWDGQPDPAATATPPFAVVFLVLLDSSLE